MRWAILCFAVLLPLPPARAADAPHITRSEPAHGATDVPLDVGRIRIVFDRDMRTTSWTLWKSESGELPPLELGETENPWVDARTVELPLGRLRPGRTYAIQLNCAARGRQGFTAADGSPLEDTVISFTAAAPPDDQPPTAARELDLGEPRPDPDREWTVLLYLAADNDVERYSTEAVDDIEARFPDKGVSVVILYDRAKGFSDTHGDFTDTRAYLVRRGSDEGKIESELLARAGEWNLGDSGSLAGFLAEGIRAFPARHYALFMWDHGSGWSGQAIDIDAPGHEGPYDELTLPEFGAGLQAGLAAAGVEKLDVVLFHMCLMGQVEVAAQLVPRARFMVASEAMIPCRYVPYGRLVAALPGSTDARDAATRLGAVYSDIYRAAEDAVSTSCVVDLARVPGLLTALDEFAGKVSTVADRQWPEISRSLFFSQNYMGRTDYRHGAQATASIDLLDALMRMRHAVPDLPVGSAFDRVEKELARCVLGRYAGTKWRLAHGLAIYAPVRRDILNPAYRKTSFGGGSAWLRMLESVHAAQERELSPPTIPYARILGPDGKETEEVAGLGGTHLEFAIEGKNILWTFVQQVKRVEKPKGYAVMFRTFVVDPRFDERKRETAAELVDLVMPEYADGRTVLRREVGGVVFQVTDGHSAFEATIDLSDPGDLGHARVPAIYSHPSEGTFRVDLFFDVNWSSLSGAVGYVETPDGHVVPKYFTPQPDAEVTFLYELITPDGKGGLLPTGKTKWGDGFTLLPMFQEPGKYAMAVTAESIGGMGAAKIVGYEQKADPGIQDLDRRGGSYSARDLAGEWQVLVGNRKEGASELEWTDTGLLARFRTVEGEANVLAYEFVSEKEADLPSGLALVDTRGAPQVIYFVKDENDDWIRSDLHIAFLLREGDTSALLAKDLIRGAVYQFVRKGGGPGPGPAPASGLPGTWRSTDGSTVIVITADQFQTAINGRIVSAGSYRVDGNRILTQYANGMSEALTFELAGDTLVLVNRLGQRIDLRRQR